MINVSELLKNSLSPDQAIRQQATQTLERASEENYPMYVQLLAQELSAEASPGHIRVAAGVALKNTFSSKDTQKKATLSQKWLSLELTIKQGVKSLLLHSLHTCPSSEKTIGAAVGQVSTHNEPRRHNIWPRTNAHIFCVYF